MMRTWVIAGMCLLAGAFAVCAETVSLEAMRILASNEPAPLDRRLERVEYQLRPLFRFEHYRHLADSSVAVNLPGSATLALGDGHYLAVNATARDGKVRVEVRWMRGQESLLSTAVNLQRGKPVILGGVPQGDGKLIVTLTAR